MRLALILAFSILLSGCVRDTGTLLYCIAVDGSAARKCR